jgi:hypothetical protein
MSSKLKSLWRRFAKGRGGSTVYLGNLSSDYSATMARRLVETGLTRVVKGTPRTLAIGS